MKDGADWYKRHPNRYLGGVVGLTSKQHCVYSLILDMLYAHGGEIRNDPSWIAGWISDMGSAAVRNTLRELFEMGKLIENEGKITEKHAKNEAKTKENLSENARKAGQIGGKKSGEVRKNKALCEADDDEKRSRLDKIREDKKEKKDSPLPPKGGGEDDPPKLALLAPEPPDETNQVFQEYQKLAVDLGIPAPRTLDVDRKKAIRARVSEHGPGSIKVAFAAIRASPFLRGETGRDGWKGVTMDWLFKPKNYRKVIEGNYAERSASQESAAIARASATGGGGRIEDIASIAMRSIGRS